MGRWAAINAMYAERSGDLQAREDAFRSMNTPPTSPGRTAGSRAVEMIMVNPIGSAMAMQTTCATSVGSWDRCRIWLLSAKTIFCALALLFKR